MSVDHDEAEFEKVQEDVLKLLGRQKRQSLVERASR